MDTERIATLTRSFLSGLSRRGLLAGLAGGLLAVPPGAFGGEEAAAKRNKRKRKRKRKKRCTPSCAGKVCGDDGCDGTCGIACSDDRVCQHGTCVCATGGVACGTRCCLPGQVCLSNGDCARTCTKPTDCAPSCGCFANLDNLKYCVKNVGSCDNIPLICGTNSSPPCPQGQQCTPLVGCASNRCVPLCPV